MNKESVYISQLPMGAEPYGKNPNTSPSGIMPNYIGAGVEPAAPGGFPYAETCTIIRNETGERCGAPQAKGTEFCIGHLRAMRKAAAEEAAKNESDN